MTDVPISSCPACGYVCDCATDVYDRKAKPSPGDISICIDCGHLMAFDDNMMLRNLTDREMREVAGNRQILTMQRARASVREKRQ